MMNKLAGRFGRYNVTAFIVMGIGVLLFLLTPLLLRLFDFDSDVLGALIFLLGLVMWVGGFIAGKVKGRQAR